MSDSNANANANAPSPPSQPPKPNKKASQSVKDLIATATRRANNRNTGKNRGAVMSHPRVHELTLDLVKGELTHKQIADKYGLKAHAIHRFSFKYMQEATTAYRAQKKGEAAETLEERIDWIYSAAKDGFELAKGDREYSGMDMMLTQAAKSVQLTGDLRSVELGKPDGERAASLTVLFQNTIAMPKVGAGVPQRIINVETDNGEAAEMRQLRGDHMREMNERARVLKRASLAKESSE